MILFLTTLKYIGCILLLLCIIVYSLYLVSKSEKESFFIIPVLTVIIFAVWLAKVDIDNKDNKKTNKIEVQKWGWIDTQK